MNSEEKAVVDVLEYFALFFYPPTIEEMHTFCLIPMKRHNFHKILRRLLKKKHVVCNESRYALSEHKRFFSIYKNRLQIAVLKKNKHRLFLFLIQKIPWVWLCGFSGSVAMMNTDKNDDIDLFVISAPGRMWMVRLILIGLALIFGIKRSRMAKSAPNAVCLNLFFDGASITVPKCRRNLFSAHDMLHMEPIVSRYNIYNIFLKDNAWVCRYFPNMDIKRMALPIHSINAKKNSNKSGAGYYVLNLCEALAKKIQMWSICRHKTTEYISSDQLWFFPNDILHTYGTGLKSSIATGKWKRAAK